MSGQHLKNLSKASIIAVVTIGTALGCAPAIADTVMTAGVIAERMPAEDRYPYVAGLLEGIAFGRYQTGGQDVAAMDCIYGWFYSGEQRTDLIFDAFERFPDYTAGAVVAALTNRACPNE